MLNKKTICILKAILNTLFGLFSSILVIGGLVIFFAGLIAYFSAGVGVQGVFSGVIFTWLGCFGLRSIIKEGCPMPIKKKG